MKLQVEEPVVGHHRNMRAIEGIGHGALKFFGARACGCLNDLVGPAVGDHVERVQVSFVRRMRPDRPTE
jgi:hypothetical protein